MGTMPVGEPTPVDLLKEIKALKKAVRDLQRRQMEEPRLEPKEDAILFSHPDEPDTGTFSPPYVYRRPDGYLVSVAISSDTPSDGDTTLRVVKKRVGKAESTTLAEVSLDGGDTYTIEDDLMEEVSELDRILVTFDQVGSGLSNVTVRVVFIESVG